jgi:hypothetical protein
LQAHPGQDVEEAVTGYSAYGKVTTTLRLNSHAGVFVAHKFKKGIALALR